MKPDYKLRWEDEEYFITKAIATTDEEGKDIKRIEAEIGWMRLADYKIPGDFLGIKDETIHDGMAFIIENTPWTLGDIEDTGSYTLALSDQSVLTWIWEWCRITGKEPRFHTIGKTIDLVDAVGVDRNLRFEYGRNIREVEKTETPPAFTRLYSFGRDDLNLVSEAGASYIEDYSWYTNQGITLIEAQQNHRKDEIVYNDDIIDSAVLYQDAQLKLSFGSQGIITYKALVVDLSYLSGVNELKLDIGDHARVRDKETSTTLPVRVSRYVEKPNEPENNQVELSFGVVLMPSIRTSNNRPDRSREWELFVSANTVTDHQVRLGTTIINRIKLRHVDNAEWVIGYSLTGTAVGSSTLTFEFTDDETGLPFWETQVFALTDGQTYDYAFTLGRKEIPEGVTTLVVRAHSSSSTAGINIADAGSNLWVLARGTTRENVTLPNSIRFDFTGAVQHWTAPDDVSEALFEVHGAGRGSIGGAGCKIVAMIPIVAGAEYDIHVGGSNGWPNGGAPGLAGPFSGGVGGGSSHVVSVGGAFASAMVVAGAGGGPGEASASNPNPFGGQGGFYAGGNSANANGATQLAGGSGGASSGAPGTFGQGGDASSSGNAFHFGGGGGGGGWYGGQGGQAASPPGQSGGGGGSSAITTTAWDLEYQDGENTGNGYIIISWETPEDVG